MGDPSSLELYFALTRIHLLRPGHFLHNKMQKETKKVSRQHVNCAAGESCGPYSPTQYWWRRGERWEVRLVKRGHFCASGKMRRVAERGAARQRWAAVFACPGTPREQRRGQGGGMVGAGRGTPRLTHGSPITSHHSAEQ